MTITELVEKLQKLQSQNPQSEVRFTIRNFNEPESKPINVGMETVVLANDSFGPGCIFRLITDGNSK